MTLRQRFLGGVAWISVGRLAVAALGIAVTAILARLLTPSDYGVVAMAAVFIGLAQQVRDFGLGQALVQLEEVREEHQKLAFTFAFGTSVVIFLMLLGAAGPIAQFYGNPDVELVMRVLAVSFPLAAFGVVPTAMLRRDLTLRGEAVATTLAMVAESIVTVALAFRGLGLWALVIGKLVGVASTSLFLSLASPWRPGVLFRSVQRGRILRFGGGVTLSSVLWYVYSNADFLLIGRVLGSGALGTYTMAWNVAKLPWDRLWMVVNPLVLPLFSRSRARPDEIGRVLRKVTFYLSIMMFPAIAGLAAVAPEVVEVLLGPNWGGATVSLIWLCVLGIFRGVAVFWGPALIASGRVRDVVIFNATCAIILPVSFFFATTWGISAVAFVWALVYPILAAAWLLPKALVASRLTATSYLSAVRAPLFATAVMVLIVLISRLLVPFDGAARLVTLSAIGVCAYAAAARLALGPIVETAKGVLRDMRTGAFAG